MKKLALSSAVAVATLFIATDIQAQQIEMIVDDVNPVYKTVQKYEDVPHTETVCYRYQRNSEGLLEKVVDGGFGSTGGLIGAGVGVAIADEIGNGSDAAKILFGLIGNKIGNDISLKKAPKTSCEEVTTYHRNTFYETIITGYNITGKVNGQTVTVERPHQPRIGSSIVLRLRVW